MDEVRQPDIEYTDNLTNDDKFILSNIDVEPDENLRKIMKDSFYLNKYETLHKNKIEKLKREDLARKISSDYIKKQNEDKFKEAKKNKRELELNKEKEIRKSKVKDVTVWISRVKRSFNTEDKVHLNKIEEEISEYIVDDSFIKLSSLNFLISKGINKKFFVSFEEDTFDDVNNSNKSNKSNYSDYNYSDSD